MNERYSRISTLTESLYIPNCPVIISNGALLKDNKDGKLIGQLKFLNTSEKSIKTISIQLDYFDADGKLIETSPIFEYPETQVLEGEYFGQKTPIRIFNSKTQIIHPKIKSITFSNEEKMTFSDCEYKKIPKQEALSSLYNNELVNQYKNDIYNEAKYIPISFDSFWVCTCGTINQISNHKCIKCTTQKNKQFLGLDHDTLYNNRQKAIEKEKIAIIEHTYNSACKRISTIKINYLDKISELEKAIKEFESIRDWKDSKDKIEQCRKKIDEIKKEKERIEIETQKEKKRKKKKIIITISSIIAIIIAINVISKIYTHIKYNPLYELLKEDEINSSAIMKKYSDIQNDKKALEIFEKTLEECHENNDLKKALEILTVLSDCNVYFSDWVINSEGNTHANLSPYIKGWDSFINWMYEEMKKNGTKIQTQNKSIFIDKGYDISDKIMETYKIYGYTLSVDNRYNPNEPYRLILKIESGWYKIDSNAKYYTYTWGGGGSNEKYHKKNGGVMVD